LTADSVITLPEYWSGLVDFESITVNLTPVKGYQRLYVKEIINNIVVIDIEDSDIENINCFYTIWAERKDIKRLVVESRKNKEQ
jgi:hypothetical protein